MTSQPLNTVSGPVSQWRDETGADMEIASSWQVGKARSFDPDIPALTGLRFLAAFSVALAHGSILLLRFDHETAVTSWLPMSAGFGMTLFFVLSGFVIHYNYRRKVTEHGLKGLAEFIWARFARLYPLFIFMVVLDFLLGSKLMLFMVSNAEGFQDVLRALPYYLVFVQSWFYVPFAENSLIYAAGANVSLTWSVSTEWFFYLAYPVVALLVLRARRPARILGGIVAWSVIWSALAFAVQRRTPGIDIWAVAHFGPIAGVSTGYQDSFVRWLLYFSPYARIGEFILGCLIAQLYLQLGVSPVSQTEQAFGRVLLVAGVLSVPLLTYLEYSPNGLPLLQALSSNFALAPSSALIIFCAARYENIISRFLRGRSIVALGEASYSIYLVHFLIFLLISSYLGHVLPITVPNVVFFGARFAFALCLVMLVSLGLHAFLEVPARSWLRGLWSGNSGSERRRVAALAVFASPAIAVFALVAAANILFPAMPPGAGWIHLVSATYGSNCGAKGGNATSVLARACDGKKTCDYRVDIANLGGDPASGCAKDFTATYVCAPDRAIVAQKVPPEAGFGSRLLLNCSAEPLEPTASKLEEVEVAAVPESSDTPVTGIHIRSATYGRNCGAKAGNATSVIAHACNGKEICDYRLELPNLGGDPANGCRKDFTTTYACAPGNAVLTNRVPPEAGLGSRLLLSCLGQPVRDDASAQPRPAGGDSAAVPDAAPADAPGHP